MISMVACAQFTTGGDEELRQGCKEEFEAVKRCQTAGKSATGAIS